MFTVPSTVALFVGAVMETEGGVVSGGGVLLSLQPGTRATNASRRPLAFDVQIMNSPVGSRLGRGTRLSSEGPPAPARSVIAGATTSTRSDPSSGKQTRSPSRGAGAEPGARNPPWQAYCDVGSPGLALPCVGCRYVSAPAAMWV